MLLKISAGYGSFSTLSISGHLWVTKSDWSLSSGANLSLASPGLYILVTFQSFSPPSLSDRSIASQAKNQGGRHLRQGVGFGSSALDVSKTTNQSSQKLFVYGKLDSLE